MRDFMFFVVVSIALLLMTLVLLDRTNVVPRSRECFYGCPTSESEYVGGKNEYRSIQHGNH